jgi:Ca2+-binding RTX toxin-like protein
MSTATRQVAFIDSCSADYESLTAGLAEGSEWFLLNGREDGLVQMARILSGYSSLDAIHVFSHGSPGALYLGSTVLEAGNLDAYLTPLQAIGSSLRATGDILLYGCEVASGEIGIQFINALAQVTGADIAASTDFTGARRLGGDFVLESSTGSIETELVLETAGALDLPLLHSWSLADSSMRGLYPELALLATKAYEQQGQTLAFSSATNYVDDQLVAAFDSLDERWTPLDPIRSFANPATQWSNGIYTHANAAAYIATANIDGKNTLEIAFRGTSVDEGANAFVDDALDWFVVTNHYAKFADLIDYLASYVTNNVIEQVYVTGHSLGGSMAQLYLQDHLANNPTSVIYKGATFAAPGADTIASDDTRNLLDRSLVQFANTRDLVPALGLNTPAGMNPEDVVANIAHEYGVGLAAGGALGGAANVFKYVGKELLKATAGAVGGSSPPKEGYYDYPGRAIWIDTPLNELPVSGLLNPVEEHDKFLYAEEVWRIAGLQGQTVISSDGNTPPQDLARFVVGYGSEENPAGPLGGPGFLDGDTFLFDKSGYLVGGRYNDFVAGGSRPDALWGLAGNDRLDGKGGADYMFGGPGDDTYYVDESDDSVNENPDEGVDTVRAAKTFTLKANVENLILEGGSILSLGKDPDINGIGNSLNNTVTGNNGSNMLSGLGGNDTLAGMGGGDQLLGGDGYDIADYSWLDRGLVVDLPNHKATYYWGLLARLQEDTLTAIEGVSTTRFDDFLYGDGENNYFEDFLGLDEYWGGGGTDGVSYANATMSISVDLLSGFQTLGGYDVLNDIEDIYGSAYADTFHGNDKANYFSGGSSSDWFYGKGGADRFHGDSGADTFYFDARAVTDARNDIFDTIIDYDQGNATNHAYFVDEGDIIDLTEAVANLYSTLPASLTDRVRAQNDESGQFSNLYLRTPTTVGSRSPNSMAFRAATR